jgi:ABC-type sugar transport system substrate-binding protein
MGDRKKGLGALVLALTIVALVAAGCGSSDDNSGDGGGSGKGTGIRAGSGTAAQTDAAAGTKAGEAAGKATLDTSKTVGIINFLKGIESGDRLMETDKAALEGLGFKVVVCDGQGTPQKFVSCGNSLLDRGVDAIIEVAIDPTQIKPVIAKAKAKNVPVIEAGGAVSPGLTGAYYPDEAKVGKGLTDYLLQKLATVSKKPAEISVHDFPAPWAKLRTDQLRAALKTNTDVKIADDVQTDAANLVAGTQKTVTDQLTQNPDLKAFWFAFDTAGQAGGPVIANKFKGKVFPDRPLIATMHADIGTTDLMRKGDIDVALDVNYDAASWVAVDNLLQYWATKQPMEQNPQPSYPGVGDLYSYKIITKDNLPPAGQYVTPKVDVPSYFQAKWKAQFGLGKGA